MSTWDSSRADETRGGPSAEFRGDRYNAISIEGTPEAWITTPPIKDAPESTLAGEHAACCDRLALRVWSTGLSAPDIGAIHAHGHELEA